MHAICISQKPEGKHSMSLSRNTLKLKTQYSCYLTVKILPLKVVIKILMNKQLVIFFK